VTVGNWRWLLPWHAHVNAVAVASLHPACLRVCLSACRPCPLLVQYVDAGWLGKKSGRGVYTYSSS
jgi:3-hydroxyacyl-CoA dehydrogenase